MRLALLADVHANAAALEAILADISHQGRIDEIVCLGDLVGYNAEPARCLDLVAAHCTRVVIGNHDRDILSDAPAPGTRPVARIVQEWTRQAIGARHRSWIESLPRRLVGEGFVAVHGCYLNSDHVTGYVTATMLPANLDTIVALGFPRVAFCGHTHQPLVGWRAGSHYEEARLAHPIAWPRDAEAVLINPGSVGQPRDRDWRAAYALVDLEARTVDSRRVEYDLLRSQRAIVEAGLPESLAERLAEGR